MSRINFLQGDAVSYSELNRLQELVSDESRTSLVFDRYVKKGILPSADGRPLGFELYVSGQDLYLRRGVAISRSNELIFLRNDKRVYSTDRTIGSYSVYIGYAPRVLEEGTVLLSPGTGTLSGTGTRFRSVLRNSTPGVPIFVQLTNETGTTTFGTFRVERVDTDTLAIIAPNVSPSLSDSGIETQILSLPPGNIPYRYRVVPYTGIGSNRANLTPFYLYDDVQERIRRNITIGGTADFSATEIIEQDLFKVGEFTLGGSSFSDIKDSRSDYTASTRSIYFSGSDSEAVVEESLFPPLVRSTGLVPSADLSKVDISMDWSIRIEGTTISNAVGGASISIPSGSTISTASTSITPTTTTINTYLTNRPDLLRVYVEGEEGTPLYITSSSVDGSDNLTLGIASLYGINPESGKTIRLVPNADRIGIELSRRAVADTNNTAKSYRAEFDMSAYGNNSIEVEANRSTTFDIEYYYVADGVRSKMIESVDITKSSLIGTATTYTVTPTPNTANSTLFGTITRDATSVLEDSTITFNSSDKHTLAVTNAAVLGSVELSATAATSSEAGTINLVSGSEPIDSVPLSLTVDAANGISLVSGTETIDSVPLSLRFNSTSMLLELISDGTVLASVSLSTS